MDTNFLLHYPVWDLDFFGGGFLVALIATVHVYVAHFAVGGGLFLVITEIKGHRENSPEILDYTKKHSKFFLLLTMVFGSMTGVGIWFVISLLSPAATSLLIHHFMFAWATEWVFFVGEIVCLFVYFYTFGKMDRRNHLRVGWLYFVFAWLSLFVINGIIAFMLTPGKWLETRDFWEAFFNPSFVPALLFRSCMAFMLAGLFGFLSSVRIKEKAFRDRMTRYCSWWLLVPFFLLMVAACYYAVLLPEPQKSMVFVKSNEIRPFIKAFLWISPLIFVSGVIMSLRVSGKTKSILAYGLLFIGLMHMGAFEWIREAGRRPFLIYGHMYSNSVLASDVETVREQGLLKSARWAKNREITDANRLEAGQEIYRLLCVSCHSVGGPMNDILPLTKKFCPGGVWGMDAFLDGMGKINTYMPPFMGNAKERKALAAYIVKGLHKTPPPSEAASPEPLPVEIPDFDPESDEHLLLAWSGLGMYPVSDCERYFTLSPPGIDIYAQLIRRGETPERLADGVKLTASIEEGFDGDALGKIEMSFDGALEVYTAKNIPLLPYKKDGAFHPYPLVSIEARGSESGKLLASGRIVAPVSTEMGCRNCHGGKWRSNNVAGISDETAKDILAVHDRMSKTDLLQRAENGQPVGCHQCHERANQHPETRNQHPETSTQKPAPRNLNLSAAIHGLHAVYLTDREGGKACASCHPSDGFTKGFRGIHREIGLDCTNCHGKMEDHALGLLAAEKEAGKRGADHLMKHLRPRAVENMEDISPRKPWVSQPDCLNCHADFGEPETDTSDLNLRTKSGKGLYRMRTDDAGMICAACHGSPHAVYPASNIFGNDRDNLPPMQHQANPYPMAANKNCKVCHTVDMEDEVHHPNSLNMFRNVR